MMRSRGTIAFVLLLTLGVCAPAASAAPLSMTFSEARVNVGVQLSDAPLFEAPFTAPFGAQIDPGSGAITAGTLGIPDFSTSITEPIEADVTVEFDVEEFNGDFVQATGELVLEGEIGGTLTATNETYAGEQCIVSTTPAVLELSTAGKAEEEGSPRSGAPFTAGLSGPGAIAGEWTDMEATPVEPGIENEDFCDNVETRIGGPGGLWLKQDDLRPPPPPTTDPPKGNNDPPPPPPPVCAVPKLAGKTLGRARVVLKKANCKLGHVGRPKRAKGKGLGPLVVKSTNPAVGAKPANGKVHLKLGPKSQARR